MKKEDVVFKCTAGDRESVFTQGPYCLKYKKGTTVEAPKNTMGIMCFDTYKNAQSFAITHSVGMIEIIRVKGIGEGRVPVVIGKRQWTGYLNLFYSVFKSENPDADSAPGYERLNLGSLFGIGIVDFNMEDRLNREAHIQLNLAPKGTICYNAVEVLE